MCREMNAKPRSGGWGDSGAENCEYVMNLFMFFCFCFRFDSELTCTIALPGKTPYNSSVATIHSERPEEAFSRARMEQSARSSARSTFLHAETVDCLPHAKTHHSFLDANAQAHHDPLFAFADIIDNSREAHATNCTVGVRGRS